MCNKMSLTKKTIWTIEKSVDEAKKYQHKVDFKKGSPRAYDVVRENGLIDVACKHMTKPPKKLYWTKERCIEAAKECKTKSEFNKRYSGAYNSSKDHGWFNELLKYFIPIGSKYKRCIYACIFEDNTIYVGLTCNLQRRISQHLHDDDSAIYKHIKETGLIPTFVQKTDYIDYDEASKAEGEILKQYNDKGFIPLNKAQTGGLGSKGNVLPRKGTKEKCIETAKKCSSYKEFREKYKSAQEASTKNDFIEDIKKILPPKCSHHIWTNETALEEAKKYKYLKDLREKASGCYHFLLKNNLLRYVRKQMILLQRDAWTFEEVYNEALKYDSKTDFRKHNENCYRACERKGWLDEVCSHMSNISPNLIYTESFVIETLKNFEYMEQLKKSEDKRVRGCYWWLKKHKKLIEFKKYLKETDKIIRWTENKAYKELAKYNTYTEFRVGSNTCYNYFVRHKRLKDIKDYYEKIRIPRN